MSSSTEYRVSDTTLESEWIRNDPWNSHYCKNCHYYVKFNKLSFSSGYDMHRYCPKCGARMKNPGYVCVEFEDYD